MTLILLQIKFETIPSQDVGKAFQPEADTVGHIKF